MSNESRCRCPGCPGCEPPCQRQRSSKGLSWDREGNRAPRYRATCFRCRRLRRPAPADLAKRERDAKRARLKRARAGAHKEN